ncbi:discoidin domain-containing protein [Luteolibacter arcticus]|uniref:Discoidin domain-containing protein n=1 Tax=Luteolibacter arcticus TaxID=1581411 RepID=A0ABT3GI18_9BACT|nr:discoidin domain-containing protein [Luteolibacter arcticus]MCW1923157.1 discoidin domain-containing protein [Luteolibacter arcticus]
MKKTQCLSLFAAGGLIGTLFLFDEGDRSGVATEAKKSPRSSSAREHASSGTPESAAASDSSAPVNPAPQDGSQQHTAECLHENGEHSNPVGNEVRPVHQDLEPDFLDRIVSGKSVSFDLPDGRKATGVVELIQHDDTGVLFVQGRLEQPAAGSYFFQRQTIAGVAGSLVGNIRFDAGSDAWKVLPTAPNGGPRLVASTVDEVLCVNYALPPSDLDAEQAGEPEVQHAPQTHPTNITIPSYQNGIIPLQSLPDATGVVYLDFDGEKGPFPSWGNFDAAHSGANNTQIYDVWKMVAEDFQGFNLNVTTDRKVYDSAPQGRRIHCMVTPTTNAAPGAGGVAFLGSYNWGGDPVCWAFYSTGKSSAEVISHEIGHTLQLAHDGRTIPAEGYYGGHGTGSTAWAPIMGVGYYANLSQWSKGEYASANNLQDDLAIIVNNNDVDYRADDRGNTLATASYLEIAANSSVSNEGIIESTGDVDAFRFVTSGGQATLNVNTVGLNPNLDILAELVNAATGVVVTSNNPDLGIDATVAANLAAGEYLLRVSGTGRGNPLIDGYTNYGSLGAYLVSGSVTGGVKPDRFSIAENSANGTSVGTVTPRNNHGGATLAYTIASGNGAGALAINGTSGLLTVANGSQFDYEALSLRWDDPPTIELLVNITNASNPSLNETVRVVVSATDANEAHSIVGTSNTSVYRNANTGTLVANFSTQGEDQFDNITWSITSGNGGGAFALSADGRLTVANSAALAAQSSHVLQITATDSGPLLPVISANHTVTVGTLLWNPGDALVVRNWTQEAGVTASQSSTFGGCVASRAIDGNTDGNLGSESLTHTDTGTNSWWEVNLGADRVIGSVQLFNRTDGVGTRLSNFRISVLDASHTEVSGQNFYPGSGSVGTSELWNLASAVTGRYVRVQFLGSNNDGNGYLSLAEVVVAVPLPANVAVADPNWAQQAGATASQSSTYAGVVASRAIDGNTEGNWNGGSLSHTDTGTNSWWEVDLGTDRLIGSVKLFNRTDAVGTRLSNFRVSVLDSSRTEIAGQNYYEGIGSVGTSELWSLAAAVTGRHVRVQFLGNNNDGNGYLCLAEVKAFASAAPSEPLATQSTTFAGGVASLAVDGNTDGTYANGSVTHTDGTTNSWWEVDLKALQSIDQIVLYNRTDFPIRLSNFKVSLWNGSTEVYSSNHFTEPGTRASNVFSLSQIAGMVADRVRVELLGNNSNGDTYLSLAEVEVYGTTATKTWTNAAGGSWTNTGNWSGGLIASGANITANFATLNLTSNATVTLDGTRTIGHLTFGDTTPSHHWTLHTGSSGPLTLDVTSGSPLVTVNNQTATIGAVLAGNDGLTKAGAGTLVLTGTNTYTTATTISGGTLQIGNGVANGTYNGTYSIGSGSTLRLTRATAAAPPWSSITGAGTLRLFTAASFDYGWGAASLGAGFTGKLSIETGRVQVNVAGLGGTNSIDVENGGQLIIYPTSGQTYTQPLTIAGNGYGEPGYPGALRNSVAASTWSGPITLAADAGIYSQTGTFTLTGPITGAHQCEFTRIGNIVVAPAVAVQNSYDSTKISSAGGSGVISAGNPYAFSTGGLLMNGGVLALNNHSFSFAYLSGTTGVIRNNGTTAASVITIGSDNSSTSYGGTLINGSTATLSFTKTGTGTLTLTGANAYTGATTISAGTLSVTGSLGATTITAQSGATLGGTGTLGGAVTVQGGGSIIPGTSAISMGTLTLSNKALTLSGTAAMQIGRTGGTLSNDKVSGISTVTYGGSLFVTDVGADLLQAGNTFQLFNATTRTGSFSNITLPTLASGLAWDTSRLAVDGTIKVATSGPILVNPYDTWAAAQGLDGSSDDPDHDGTGNLLEFYLDGDPLAADGSTLRVMMVDTTHVVLTFHRRDDAEAHVSTELVQWGSDLAGWTDVALGGSHAGPDANGVVVEVIENDERPDDITVSIPRELAISGKLFARLKVTE